MLEQAIIDPIRNRDSSSNKHAFDHDKLAALVRLRGLRLPHRHSRSVHAIAPSSNQSSNDPLGEIVRSALQQSANSHDDRSDEDGLLTTERVADEDSEYSTAKASQVVGGDCNALVCRSSGG